MTEEELRRRIVTLARSWLGRGEADGSHGQIIAIYNAHRPLARGYRMTDKDPWCAAMVSALSVAAGLTGIIPAECSCRAMMEKLQAMDSWNEKDDFLPKPGDLLFYDWQDRERPSDNRGQPDHVGVVESVCGRMLAVIEGNLADRVDRRRIAADGRFIRGYGVPDYLGEAARRSVEELACRGIIDSPDYWRQRLLLKEIPYLEELLSAAAGAVLPGRKRVHSAEEGIAGLVCAGVIRSPEYWRKKTAGDPALAELMRALGGAVPQCG